MINEKNRKNKIIKTSNPGLWNWTTDATPLYYTFVGENFGINNFIRGFMF